MKKINLILVTLIAIFSWKIIYKKEKNSEYKYTLEKLSNFDNDKNLKVFVNGTEDNLDSAVKKAINQNMTSSDKKKLMMVELLKLF